MRRSRCSLRRRSSPNPGEASWDYSGKGRPSSLSQLFNPVFPLAQYQVVTKAGSSVVCVLFFTSSSAHRKFPALSYLTFRTLELCSCLTSLNSRASTAQHLPMPLVSLGSPQNPSSFPERLVLPASETPKGRGVSIREEAFKVREILISSPRHILLGWGKNNLFFFQNLEKNENMSRQNFFQPSWSLVPKSSHT